MLYKKNFLTPFLAVLSVVFAIIAYNRGMRADINGDYHIYWQTGKNFIAGQKIYTPGLADGGFTYPPFAAMLFCMFSIFPFHISAFLFTYLINYGLWVVSILLTRKIILELFPGIDLMLPLSMAVLLSITFYWHNFIWMNANLPVLCATLVGILNYNRKKFTLAYVFFLAGAFFKVTPIIFLLFAAIKRGPKDWPKILVLTVPFVIVPLIFRGFNIGIQDWRDYYQAFVAPFSKGQIDENIISLGIPAMLNKLNGGNLSIGFAPLLNIKAGTLKLLILIIQIAAFGAVTVKFIYDRYILHKEQFSAADYSLMFLITLLLPGRVWAHHHVCIIFIFTYLFLLIRNKKILFIITVLLCAIMSMITKGAIGQALTDVLRQFTYVTWVMIYITVVIIWLSYFEKKKVELDYKF